jgi:UPF0755 protein
VTATGPPPVPGTRSAEERERARRLREVGRGTGERAPGSPRRGRRAVVFAVVALLLGWFLFSLFQPLKGEGQGRVRVVIPPGAGAGEIADLLEERGVISSSFFFELRATLSGSRGDLKPGTFSLRRDMSYGAALDLLTVGPPPNVVSVTIPEGRSREEIAPILRRAGIGGSYAAATRRARALDPRRYGAEEARSLEGFLFPATYELKRGASARQLVSEQLAAFKGEFREVDLSTARRKNLTPYDVLIIASMVEREAQVPAERRLIASVIYNRLRERIPLGVDATIRFAIGNWQRPLTRSELQIRSPYNTRLNQGLPPGPIGNPGLAAIRAAARPARTGFLYYVVKPNTCGEHDFSTSAEQFERDRRRYEAERARRGGRSPTDCPS